MVHRGGPGRVRRLLVVLLVLAFVLVGCTYERQEPGLFPTSTSTPTRGPTTPGRAPRATSAVPVAGDAVWTSGDGLDITVRWAVHAVRRIPGATVLDWSVTPLAGPNLRTGDPVPLQTNLGLSHRGGEYDNVFLLDLRHGRVYRPLTQSRDPSQHCLCTLTSSIGDGLRLGVTTLLQTAFPELPRSLRTVDVDISTVPPFTGVPVNQIGSLPRAGTPVNLARPATRYPPAATTIDFAYRPGYQRFVIDIDAVEVSATFTTIAWSIRSVTSGLGLEAASRPPFADERPPAGLSNQTAAGGPQAVVTDRGQPPLRNRLGVPNRVLVATAKLVGRDARECLCTDLRDWPSSLSRADQEISAVTILPALEIGYSGVDVVVPRVQTVQDVGTSAAAHPALGPGSKPYLMDIWAFAGEPTGWAAKEWPTPVPGDAQLADTTATVDRIVR